MKFSAAILLAALSGTSAFVHQAPRHTAMSVRMSEDSSAESPVDAVTETMAAEAEPAVVAAATLPEMSQSMPFMKRPSALDGSMAGDVGFDPLGFAKDAYELKNYREAEIKHARLAMLAAAGWPLSELFDKKIANFAGLTPLVDASDRAPSVLNGGLEKVSPIYWGVCLAAAAAIDLYGIRQSGKEGYFPGNLGFDPLGMYPQDEEGQKRMQLAEIKNGRLAMIAITAFAAQEFVTKFGVVDETPLFFKPLSETFHQYANSGYIYH